MEQKNFKRQVWVGIGIVAGSMVIFGVAFYVLVGQYSKTGRCHHGQPRSIATQSALINSYSNLKANTAVAATYQAAMDKLLASQDNLISFPSQIEGVARNDGIDVAFAFQGDPVPASAKYGRLCRISH